MLLADDLGSADLSCYGATDIRTPQGKAAVKARTVFWRYRRANNNRKAVPHGDWKRVNDNRREELDNMREDPNEQRDLLAAQPALVADLRGKIEKDVRAPRLAEFH
ncbi:MAG: hypothetical protein HY820_23980 [Acidobacteria bacterium]|nr:hypothetical protein [Acidobacteriota bacterium]